MDASGTEDELARVQLLVEDRGNREALSRFIEDRYAVCTDDRVREADAYVVEDPLLASYHDALEAKVTADDPIFRPVVLLRRGESKSGRSVVTGTGDGEPSVVADVIETPVDAGTLQRRLESLLGRREQSQAIQAQAAAMERQRDALDVLNQMVRHDIRNDLQLVRGYAQQLAEEVESDRRESVDRVIAATDAAIELTTEARDLTDLLLAEDADIGAIRVGESVEEEVAAVSEANPDASIEVAGTVPDCAVVGDDMFASVVRNLLTNAVRHTDSSSPEITVTVTEHEDSVSVRVADDGPGIPDERKTAIFEKGESARSSPGSGIGLYLVSAIVDRYGGTVSVEDAEPTGAVFVISLPKA